MQTTSQREREEILVGKGENTLFFGTKVKYTFSENLHLNLTLAINFQW